MSKVKGSQGFTLVEILIAVALLVIIMTLGLFISFDFYRSYAFRAERNTIVSILQKARNQSLNNINQTRHGVHFQDSPTLQYIIYECPGNILPCTYAPSTSDIIIDSSWGMDMISPPTPPMPFDVVFNQLNGSCVAGCSTGTLTIRISDGIKLYDIAVNSAGRINW